MRRLALLVPVLLASHVRPALGAPAPIACDLMSLADVRGVLGASWQASPASFNTNTDKMTTCYYQNGVGNIVAFSMVYPPKGDAKAELAKRQANLTAKHPITPYPKVCEGAYAWVVSATNTTFIAAKATWMVQIQVMVANKPDVESDKKLATIVCGKL